VTLALQINGPELLAALVFAALAVFGVTRSGSARRAAPPYDWEQEGEG